MAQTWRTVRVFVSSTFRDMHAERDHLGKVVFPELRERCAGRQLHLVDVDLRWGVTEEEVEQGKLLDIVLGEVERSRPFFVAILGERYGFVPETVPEDVHAGHPWLRDHPEHSITAMEIVHGALRNPELARRSFFYFRDPQLIAQIPESTRPDYAAEGPEAANKLSALKDQIRASGRPVIDGYPCRWDQATRRVMDLDAFGERVLEDLWAAIGEEYPEGEAETDPVILERQMHEVFAEERSRLHVGRVDEATRLTEYVQETDWRPVVVTGDSGCGKSAFLASWSHRYADEHPESFVLTFFIGASPESTDHFHLLRKVCQDLKRTFSLAEEIPQQDSKLSDTLAAMLATVARDRGAYSADDRCARSTPAP